MLSCGRKSPNCAFTSPCWPSKGLTVVLLTVGTVCGEGPYCWQRRGALLRTRHGPQQPVLVRRGARAMVAVPTGTPSPRTAALVLAVLGYRRRLRRRDRWSGPALLAHQDRALRRLRNYAYQQSRFYQDFHAGLSSAPLSALPVLTKQTLMDSFDSAVTRPGLRLADIENYLATLRGNDLFQGRYFVSATAGTTGTRSIFVWPSGNGCRLSLPTIARSTGPAPPPAWLIASRRPLSAQPIPVISRLAWELPFTVVGCPRSDRRR